MSTRLHWIALAGALLWWGCTSAARSPEAPATTAQDSTGSPASSLEFACPGRVEGWSETVDVGASIDGVIKALFVEEGTQVRRGHWLARIDCPELPASLAAAEADVERARLSKVRLLRGSREEERQAAEQRTAAARAVLQQATAELTRIRQLVEEGVLARVRLEDVTRDFQVAEARLQEALRQEALVKAHPLPEEVARADAEIERAQRQVEALQEKQERCVVKAPSDGTVLRILMRPGQTFSTVTPGPILQLADLSRIRVRAEIDERDVAKARVHQPVVIHLDGSTAPPLPGRVASLSPVMGRKKIRTGDPAEKADRDVLEAVIDVEPPAAPLPVGLRVLVRFLAAN